MRKAAVAGLLFLVAVGASQADADQDKAVELSKSLGAVITRDANEIPEAVDVSSLLKF
jgi:hypothetical protein